MVCAFPRVVWYLVFLVPYPTSLATIYKNLDGWLFFMTKGCRCTLGIRPRPIALRIALAIFLWFLGRRPVSLECLMRPVSVMYSDMIVKFLYSRMGLMPKTSKASSVGLLRPYFHFFCSAPDRSCGA